MRAAIAGAASFDDAAAALLTAGAAWTPDALATLLGDAMELAALEGREAVFTEAEGSGPAFGEITFERQEFPEAIEFLTQKRPKPTRVWTDAMHNDHDRSLVVAGVTDLAMLEEFQAALIEGARTLDIKPFAAEFDRLAEKYGWSYNGGRNWRIRTIFETNIRTSYMAGRLRQMRDPDMVRMRPFWQYRHAETRVPLTPREEHVRWNNLVLDWNDPWWDIHFPPNDWQCSCGVRTLSRGDLKRLGKTGPDTAPEIVRRPHLDKASGQIVQLPEGVGFGWDYMPGDHWQRGLTPQRLTQPPDVPPAPPVPQPAPPPPVLRTRARPAPADLLPPGLPDTDNVQAFLSAVEDSPAFDAPFLTDKTGHRLAISEELFRDAAGTLSLHPGPEAAEIAKALTDPDEIWLGLRVLPEADGTEEVMATRRYLRLNPATGLYSLFEIGRRFWWAITGIWPAAEATEVPAALAQARAGKMLWQRSEDE